ESRRALGRGDGHRAGAIVVEPCVQLLREPAPWNALGAVGNTGLAHAGGSHRRRGISPAFPACNFRPKYCAPVADIRSHADRHGAFAGHYTGQSTRGIEDSPQLSAEEMMRLNVTPRH